MNPRNGLKDRIAKLDEAYGLRRPQSVKVDGVSGKIIYSREPAGIFGGFDPLHERIASVREVVGLRLESFDALLKANPSLAIVVDSVCADFRVTNGPEILGWVLETMRRDPKTYGIWQVRLTTSTSMVRTYDEHGVDTVFFYTGNPFGSPFDMMAAMDGEISDGGIQYHAAALSMIRGQTPESSRLSYADYLAAKGGNFSGSDLLNHPVFATAIGDPALLERYVFALQVLNLLDFYNRGMHSGWRPGEMKRDFGRPISLGYKGEAFYPPNNSTVDHAALVLPVL